MNYEQRFSTQGTMWKDFLRSLRGIHTECVVKGVATDEEFRRILACAEDLEAAHLEISRTCGEQAVIIEDIRQHLPVTGSTCKVAARPGWKLDPYVVVDMVALAFGMARSDMVNRRRWGCYTQPRAIISFLLYEKLGAMSLTQIGELMGRDHSTVMYQVRRYHEWYQVDAAFRDKADALVARAMTYAESCLPVEPDKDNE